MKRLILFLALVSPAFSAITVSDVYADNISHGTALIHLHITNPSPNGDGTLFLNSRICWSTTAGACAARTAGTFTILGQAYPNSGTGKPQMSVPDLNIILTGLPESSFVEACPELSNNGTTWTADSSCAQFVTLGKPTASLHGIPALPRVSGAPSVPTNYSTFHAGASAGGAVIGSGAYPVTSCANLQADIQAAVGNQTSFPTLIALAAGATCSGRYYPNSNPPDVRIFNDPDVSTGANTIHIGDTTFTAALTEGHGVQFSKSFRSLPGETNTPALACTGIKPGQVYFAHNVNTGASTFQLTCDKPYSQGGKLMLFHDAGSGGTGFGGMYIAAYPRRADQGGSLYPIVIHTSTPEAQLPPPGTRISPAWQSKLSALRPDCRAPSANACVYPPTGFAMQEYALNFGTSEDDNTRYLNANMWAVGLEIKAIDATGDTNPDPLPTWDLLSFKEGTSDNGVDRCYIHGIYPFPSRLAHGFSWEGHNNAITNSYFDKIVYPFHNGGDTSYQTEGTQFFESEKGPGPYFFVNNFFQSTGNGMHFNGAGDSGFNTKISQDIYIQRNTFTQNPAANHGQYCFGRPGSDGWEYRNRQPFEVKGGRYVWLDGNIFEYDCKYLASANTAFTSVAAGIFDVTLTNNTWRHDSAVGMMGSSTEGGLPIPQSPTSRYLYRNNLMWDIDGDYIDHNSFQYTSTTGFRANGWIIQTVQDGEDMTFDHNTVVSSAGYTPAQFWLANGGVEGLKVTNSILYANSDTGNTGNGVRVEGNVNPAADSSCSGSVQGSSYAAALLQCAWRFPNPVVSGNLLTSDALTNSQVVAVWPTQKTTATPSNLSLVGWVQPSYSAILPDFHYKAGSNYISGGASAATDNLDQGADIQALEKAQGRVYFTSVVPASTTATVAFVAPDAQGCPVDVSKTDSTLINSFTRFADAGGAEGPRTVSLTGLTARSDYFYRINCAVQQPTGTFHTN